MDLYQLKAARSGAKSGFISNFDNQAGPPVEVRATEYFQRQREKQRLDEPIVHDREYPQPPPHHYSRGNPGPLHYGVPLSDGMDAGVYAVSNALFGSAGAFQNIPIKFSPVFRRRRRGDGLPEWSNAFVTQVDPCECTRPEEAYTPYEVARYRDQQGRVVTALDFENS